MVDVTLSQLTPAQETSMATMTVKIDDAKVAASRVMS